MTPKQIVFLATVAVVGAGALFLSGSMVENLDAGHVHVLQTLSGDMSVKTTPGWYWQGFGKVTDYPISEDLVFGPGDDSDIPAVRVIFNDSATADVSGNVRFRLPVDEKSILELHQTYRGIDGLVLTALPKLVAEALGQTSPLMKAEESYSSRRAEFTETARNQLTVGIYAKTSREVPRKNSDGTDTSDRVVEIKLDENGLPVVQEPSPLKVFNIQLLQFTVTGFDYDQKTDELIGKRKETEQLRITARAEAETAKMNAIKAEEEGKANVAVAKAKKEVEKISAVTEAEKEFEVAKFAALQAQEEAKKQLSIAKAEAEGARLKVAAGLTPQEKAQFAKETAIGVAEALAKTQWPSIMNFGGDKGPQSPLDALSWESQYDLAKKMATDRGQ
jgi:regulator of protease activity HflC (stomatin/prohibitin superfamily)